MPINPLYAKAMADESGVGREQYPSVRFDNVGDKVIGKVVYVGDTFERPNKFYEADKPGSKQFILTQKIVIEKEDGTKVALFLGKLKQYAAIGKALEEAGQSDIPIGWTLAFKFSGYEKPKGGGSPATTWEARILPPSE
jgi:hypothetical protein